MSAHSLLIQLIEDHFNYDDGYCFFCLPKKIKCNYFSDGANRDAYFIIYTCPKCKEEFTFNYSGMGVYQVEFTINKKLLCIVSDAIYIGNDKVNFNFKIDDLYDKQKLDNKLNMLLTFS